MVLTTHEYIGDLSNVALLMVSDGDMCILRVLRAQSVTMHELHYAGWRNKVYHLLIDEFCVERGCSH